MATKQPHPLDAHSDEQLKKSYESGWFDSGKPLEKHRSYVEKRLGIQKSKSKPKALPKFKKLPHNISPSTVKSRLANMSQGELKFHSENHPNEAVRGVIKNHIRTFIPHTMNKSQLADLHHRFNNMSDAEVASHAENHPNKSVRELAKGHLEKKGQTDIFGASPKGAYAKEPEPEYLGSAKKKAKQPKLAKQTDIFGTKPVMMGKDETKKTIEKRSTSRTDQLSHSDPRVRARAIGHPGTTRHEIAAGLTDPDHRVAAAAAFHPNATHGHINYALRHRHPAVRIAAINNPNISRRQVVSAIQAQHQHKEVLDTAKKKLERMDADKLQGDEHEAKPVEPKSEVPWAHAAKTSAGETFGRILGKIGTLGYAGAKAAAHGIGKAVSKGKEVASNIKAPKKIPKAKKRIEPTISA